MRYLLPTIAAGLASLAFVAPAIPQTHPSTQSRYVQPRAARYWVQFRQPFWREHAFDTRQEMDQAIDEWQRNGWEVQVPGEYRVRFRLMQWGGSRVFDYLPDAQSWARTLEDHEGYETRIVHHP